MEINIPCPFNNYSLSLYNTIINILLMDIWVVSNILPFILITAFLECNSAVFHNFYI